MEQIFRVGIIGAGSIAASMAETVGRMPEAHLYAIASRSIEKAREFQDKWGAEKAYGSYDELIQDEKVDLIYIATPHSHHYEQARQCLLNGKAVLCERHLQPTRRRLKNWWRWPVNAKCSSLKPSGHATCRSLKK